MKRVDPEDESLLSLVPSEMVKDGYQRLQPNVLEKDLLVTEALIAVMNGINLDGYQPVFCGGTCLSKAYGLLDRMSEDVDIKIVRALGLEEISVGRRRRDLGEIRLQAKYALQEIGYPPEDLTVESRDSNQYYTLFLDDMVYAAKADQPSFTRASTVFTDILERVLVGDSPNIQAVIDAQLERKKAAIKARAKR